MDLAPEQEELLESRRTEPVEQCHDPAVGVRGPLLEQALDQQRRELSRRCDRLLADARLSVHAHPDSHVAGRQGEQRVIGAGERAACERDPEGERPGVGSSCERCDTLEVVARSGRGPGHLNDHEIACGTTALVTSGRRRAGHVVGDRQIADTDTGGLEAPLGFGEVQLVAGVVAIGKQHATAVVRRSAHRDDLVGGGRGEDITHGGTISQPRSHPPAEGGVVARPATGDDGGRRDRGPVLADDAAVDRPEQLGVQECESPQVLPREVRGAVQHAGHVDDSW